MTDVRFPGESAEYRRLRNELLTAELTLKDQRERVAELRRQLPLDGTDCEDYRFREGPADLDDQSGPCFDTRLSDLFAPGKDQLIVQHLMFAPEAEQACPMCSMWTDGFNAIVPHLTQRASFAVIAKADIEKLRAWGRLRGWNSLRLLSSHDSRFNEDFNVELDGAQVPAVSVFARDSAGSVRHFYTTEGSLEFRHHRAMDLFTPVWNLLDLLPDGRGDWMPG